MGEGQLQCLLMDAIFKVYVLSFFLLRMLNVISFYFWDSFFCLFFYSGKVHIHNIYHFDHFIQQILAMFFVLYNNVSL